MQQKIRDGMQKTFAPGDEPLLQLPASGVSADDLRKKLAFKVYLGTHCTPNIQQHECSSAGLMRMTARGCHVCCAHPRQLFARLVMGPCQRLACRPIASACVAWRLSAISGC